MRFRQTALFDKQVGQEVVVVFSGSKKTLLQALLHAADLAAHLLQQVDSLLAVVNCQRRLIAMNRTHEEVISGCLRIWVAHRDGDGQRLVHQVEPFIVLVRHEVVNAEEKECEGLTCVVIHLTEECQRLGCALHRFVLVAQSKVNTTDRKQLIGLIDGGTHSARNHETLVDGVESLLLVSLSLVNGANGE